VPGLPQIGGTGQKRKPPVGAEIEALEEAEAERVIAGEVVHALLIEHQETIEVCFGQFKGHPLYAVAILGLFEM
jgi:hypothetical protein